MGALLVVLGMMNGARAAGARGSGSATAGLHPTLRMALETALGLLAISIVALVVALAGMARPSVLVAVWALVTLGGLIDIAARWRARGGPRTGSDRAERGRRVGLGLLLGAWAAWAAAAATLPPTAIDELVYQLEVPRRTLEAGHLPVFADNIYGGFPQGGGMLFLLGLAVAGPAAAKLLHAGAGILVALALYGGCRQLAPRAPALVAPAAFLTVPTVVVLGAWAYVDLLFSLFLLLALLLLAIRMPGDEAPGLGDAVLAGVLAGGAWSVKYTGLQVSLLLSLVLLFDHLWRRHRTVPWTAVLLPGTALLVASPWLLRNWWTMGWPLFPFPLPGFELADGANWSVERADLFVRWLAQYGGGPDRGALERLAAPLLVLVNGRFGGAFDGVAGPVFLLAPLAWLGRRPDRRLGLLALFCGAYLAYWTLTTTQVRFLVPVLAPISLLLAAALGPNRRRWLAAAALLMAVGLGLAGAEVARWQPQRYWLGQESTRAYVDRRVPVAAAYRAAEARLQPGDTAYLVNMKHLGFLLERAPAYVGTPGEAGWRSDYVFQHYRLAAALGDGPDAVDSLMAESGATHLLIDERITLAALDVPERRALAEYLRRRAVRTLLDPAAPYWTLWALRPRPSIDTDGRAGP